MATVGRHMCLMVTQVWQADVKIAFNLVIIKPKFLQVAAAGTLSF